MLLLSEKEKSYSYHGWTCDNRYYDSIVGVGDVYGAGNGSYSYTDNPALGALDKYKDFYYNPAEVRLKEREYNNPTFEYSSTDADILESRTGSLSSSI